MRKEHEQECEMFEYFCDTFGIDKSSTFRAPREPSLYKLWIKQPSAHEKHKGFSESYYISYCPFCGKWLRDYD